MQCGCADVRPTQSRHLFIFALANPPPDCPELPQHHLDDVSHAAIKHCLRRESTLAVGTIQTQAGMARSAP